MQQANVYRHVRKRCIKAHSVPKRIYSIRTLCVPIEQ